MTLTLNSHTHFQVAQANAKIKALQIVCLYDRWPKPSNKRKDKEEALFSIMRFA
ncbi:MAG: hypothetical protein IPJ51_24500 [Saprospiraceae bacterium]|nr:hypothetical protein [Saprospiraceae bacterium]